MLAVYREAQVEPQDRGLLLRTSRSPKRSEERLRWDRLVAFHLILVGFINTIGYPEHQTSKSEMQQIASQIRNKIVLDNLVSWLPRHGLKDKEARRIRRACNQVSDAT